MSRENGSNFLGLDTFECKIYPYVVGVSRIPPRSHVLSRSTQRDEASEKRKMVPITETVPSEGYSTGVGRAERDLDTCEKLGFRENWHFLICLRLTSALSLEAFQGSLP